MAVCPNCGAQNYDGAKFCTSCGGPLPVAQPVQQQPVQQPVQQAQPEAVQIPNPQQQYWTRPSSESVPVTPAEQPIPIAPAQPVYAQPITQPVQNRANRPKSNGWCNAGLALSIIGWCTMGITAPFGLLFSLIGLIVSSKKRQPGRGKAIAGLILSGVLIFSLAISLPMVWADVQKEFERGNITNPMELIDTLDEATDKQTDYSNKYVKKIVASRWVSIEDASCMEFKKDKSFKYFVSYEDLDDNYISGNYRIFTGEKAIDMLTSSYKSYGVKKSDVQQLMSDNSAFKEDNFVLIVFENDGQWVDGENIKDKEWETACYGFLVTSPDPSLLLIDMSTDIKLSFIQEDDYEKIKDQINPTTTEPTTDSTTEATVTEADPDAQTMGDSITGTVTLTQGKWDIWNDAVLSGSNFDSVQSRRNRETQTIINLCVYKNTYNSTALKQIADSLKNGMQTSGYSNIDMKTTTIGGFEAYEISGKATDGMYVNAWLFLDNNNKFHYITIEYFESDKASYEMVRDTYKLG